MVRSEPAIRTSRRRAGAGASAQNDIRSGHPPRPDAGTLLFAYGTLMRGEPLHHLLLGRSTPLGPGTVSGRLLSLGRYPGHIAGAGRVRGELYRLDDVELLATLDREEGYNFERRHAVVRLSDGRRPRAWIYRYRGPRSRATLIPAGDWRNRWR